MFFSLNTRRGTRSRWSVILSVPRDHHVSEMGVDSRGPSESSETSVEVHWLISETRGGPDGRGRVLPDRQQTDPFDVGRGTGDSYRSGREVRHFTRVQW